MVEKGKMFKVGDKVFGKVKGYPAWPAQITSLNGKRYGVVFYGTNETSTLKQDDIFYYLSSKHKFPMQKRRFYADAIKDIESDIKNCGGSDGNENPHIEEEPPQPKTTKRKRHSLAANKKQDSSTSQAKRLKVEDQNHNLNEITSENHTDIKEIEKVEENTISSETETKSVKNINDTLVTRETEAIQKIGEKQTEQTENVLIDSIKNLDVKEAKIEEPKKENTETNHKNDSTTSNETNEIVNSMDKADESKNELPIEGVNLLPDFYFDAIILYAERVQGNSHYYKISKPDPVSLDDPSDNRQIVLPVKIDNDKYCGLIYSPKTLDNYCCEYDRALDDAKLAQELLELKAEIDVGNLNLRDSRFVKHLDCDDTYVQDSINQSLMAYKKSKFEWLQNEMDVFKTLVDIKKCLGLKETKTKDAVAHMMRLLIAQIEPISLKKRSFFVETVLRLRRYVGNIPDWQLSESALAEFEVDASVIRDTADQLYAKIADLFGYKDKADAFLDYFHAQCEQFNAATKSMNEAAVFALCAEPLSRKAQLELILDEQASANLKTESESSNSVADAHEDNPLE